MEHLSSETLIFILGIAGSIIVFSFALIGFFLKTLHNDVRKNTQETGKNKGRIELVEQNNEGEIKRLTEVTQLEIKGLAEKVGELSVNINTLVQGMIKK